MPDPRWSPETEALATKALEDAWFNGSQVVDFPADARAVLTALADAGVDLLAPTKEET